MVLDDVSKAIIEQLQQDGRRSYAAIGKVVGLSEAAVRQRVQRLTDSGVMQVVAVTDPLELGLRPPGHGRHPGAAASSSPSPTRSPSSTRSTTSSSPPAPTTCSSRSCAESDEHLLELISRTDPLASTASLRPRRSCTSSCASRPTRGECAEHVGLPVALPLARDTAAPTGRPGRRCPATSRSTSRSSAPGFTGLWTAYYLAEADPSLRIVVLEAEVAGFGASGRNGGWCSALFPASLDKLAGAAGGSSRPAGALAQHAAMRATVDEVGRAIAAEGIDAHCRQGRHHRARPDPGPAAPRPGRGRATPALGPRRGRRPAARRARRRRRCCAATRTARRDVHPGLRRDPPRPARARAGRGRRAPRRHHPRGHPRRPRSSRVWSAPTAARCAPTSWSARPRATPPSLRGRRPRASPRSTR